MNTIETKLKELERLNCLFPDVQQLIAALREAVAGLNYVADHENIGRSVYSDTDPERARQSLAKIEKILGDQK